MLLTDELWEAQMASRGVERAQREFDKRAKGGNIGETPAGRDLIQKVITDLGNKIAEFMVNAEAKRGVKPMLHQKAGHLDPFVISFIGIRGALNAACRERASLIVAGRNIGKMLEAESRAQWMQQSDPGRFESDSGLPVASAIRKRPVAGPSAAAGEGHPAIVAACLEIAGSRPICEERFGKAMERLSEGRWDAWVDSKPPSQLPATHLPRR